MAAFSNYVENKLIDFFFRAATFAKPTALYWALYTAAPSDAGGGTEVTGGSYARVNLAPSDTNYLATQGGTSGNSSGTGGATSNAVVITFPAPTANWGTVTHFAIFDGPAGSSPAENVLFHGAFTASKVISNGDQAPVISVNGATVTLA